MNVSHRGSDPDRGERVMSTTATIEIFNYWCGEPQCKGNKLPNGQVTAFRVIGPDKKKRLFDFRSDAEKWATENGLALVDI